MTKSTGKHISTAFVKEITCDNCNLPVLKGLPPFIKASAGYRHTVCPPSPKETISYVKLVRERFAGLKAEQRERNLWHTALTEHTDCVILKNDGKAT